MPDATPTSPKPWFASLFDPFLQGMVDLSAFVELTFEGHQYGTVAPETIARLRESHERAKESHPLLDDEVYSKSIANATRLQEFAKRESDRKFPYLHGLAAIKLLALMEALVNDLAAQTLMHSPSAWTTPSVQAVKGPLVPFERLPIHARADTIVTLLRKEIDAKPPPGIARFESLLDAVGLSGNIHPLVRKAILELREVRNCIVHRYGVAGDRLVEYCPWLGLAPGEDVRIDNASFMWYFHAVMWYEFELWLRWLDLDPKHTEESGYPQSLNEGKSEFIAHMERSRPPRGE